MKSSFVVLTTMGKDGGGSAKTVFQSKQDSLGGMKETKYYGEMG